MPTIKTFTYSVLIHSIILSSHDAPGLVYGFTRPNVRHPITYGVLPSNSGICIQELSSSPHQHHRNTRLHLWKNFNRGDESNDVDNSDSKVKSDDNSASTDDEKVNPAVEKLQEIISQNEALSKFATSIVSLSQKFIDNLEKIKLVAASFTAGIVLTISLTVYTVFSTIGEESISPVQESAALMETILTDLTKGYVDEVDSRDLFETGVSAMLSSLDPYTEFENVKDAEAMQESITSKYGGIGLVIQEVSKNKKGEDMLDNVEEGNEVETDYQITAVDDDMNAIDGKTKSLKIKAVKAFEGYAFDHGMRTGDELVAIDDRPISTFSSIDDVRNKLRGELPKLYVIRFWKTSHFVFC